MLAVAGRRLGSGARPDRRRGAAAARLGQRASAALCGPERAQGPGHAGKRSAGRAAPTRSKTTPPRGGSSRAKCWSRICVPAGTRYYVAGAAAHLTEDTREKLREFAELHLEALQREQPDATWDDLIRTHSETLNHFVMQLPVEEPNPTLLDNIVTQTRISLKLAGESLGIGRKDDGVRRGDMVTR